ncbi:LuxR C-terminal-related transcriptional regulator [Ktedonosporobacter rubrisoli]|nr:LuxR C-terminal-related transcriptional regulator [Ktedonosporobacter rubrisoli]
MYILYEQGNAAASLQQGEDERWSAWLGAHTSFSFQGKCGHINLQKERRARGQDGYWYAFRRIGKRVVKKYAGRAAELSFAHLESLAQLLDASASKLSPVFAPAAASLSFQHQMPLLASKLQLPRQPSSLIERWHLLARLDAARKGKLTLLSAPAGFGKTTLVRQWISERKGSENTSSFPLYAWLNLDPDDNDPLRFWHYLIAACQNLYAGLGQSALASYDQEQYLSFRSFSLEAIITAFLNELTVTLTDGILVLDDYHVISSPQIHKTLLFFLDHLPASLHILIITRIDPPFPLTRLRAHHELYELRASDLRFSAEETSTFFQQTMSLALSSEMITQCEALLEGWATGLHLLSLLLQEQLNQQTFKRILESFAASNQTLIDYFVGEVLSTQPQAIQDFLLQTSMLSRLCGSLCNTILGCEDSERVLAELAHANLFMQPLYESEPVAKWYRYHPLFAEAMQYEARRRLDEGMMNALCSRASQWFEQHGMFIEAIDVVGKSGNFVHQAELIEKLIDTRHYLENNEFHTLRRWLERMPEALLRQRPRLAFSYALALVFTPLSDYLLPQELQHLHSLLLLAEERFRQQGDLPKLGEIFAFRALLAHKRGALREAGTWARQALAWLEPRQEALWQAACLAILGEEAHHASKLTIARKTLQEAQAIGQNSGNRSFTRTVSALLGEVCFEQGALRLAAEYYRQMLRGAREQRDINDIGHAQIGMAWLLYEWNELAEAELAVREAVDIGKLLAHEELQIQAELLQARLESACGHIASAGQRYASLLVRLQQHDLPLLTHDVLFWQARWQLMLGDFSAVHRWLNNRGQHSRELPQRYQAREEILIARLLLMEKNIEESIEMLQRQLQTAHAMEHIHSALEIQVLLAQAYAEHKQRPKASELLRTTLIQAQAEGYMRLFLDEGEALTSLLQTLTPREPQPRAYLRNILHAANAERREQHLTASPASSILIPPLSSQEHKVLRLLAAGSSNPEIAQTLVVSVTTVRSQVQSIYRKLGVNNRVAASEIARHLQLL